MKSCCPYKHVKQSLLLHPFEIEWTRLICILEREVTIEVREGSYNTVKSFCLSECTKKNTIVSFQCMYKQTCWYILMEKGSYY